VVVHEDWAVRGHAMVVWKAHVENIGDLTEADARHLILVHRVTERALLRLTGAQRAILMKLGIATPHLHLHIYPVSSALTREEVMDIIDAAGRQPRDAAFITTLRAALRDLLDSTRTGE
jgi:diadenosine tetraphosphate (Ap4A) HIT family hydrolase